MDMMTRIGGRKFLMALVVVSAAMFLELRSDKGLSTTMAGFLLGIVGTFSVANYATTAKHMASKKQDGPQSQSSGGMSPEQMNAMVDVLTQLGNELKEVKETAVSTGKAVVALAGRR